MKRACVFALAVVAGATSLVATSVNAQTPIFLGDIKVLKQPLPTAYQPEGTTNDLADAGKSFDVACIITATGTLSDCRALDNDIYDPNFIRVALGNIGHWVVAPTTLDGRSAVGRTLTITVQVQRTDLTEGAVAMADAR